MGAIASLARAKGSSLRVRGEGLISFFAKCFIFPTVRYKRAAGEGGQERERGRRSAGKRMGREVRRTVGKERKGVGDEDKEK
jgi:hypothetical protein